MPSTVSLKKRRITLKKIAANSDFIKAFACLLFLVSSSSCNGTANRDSASASGADSMAVRIQGLEDREEIRYLLRNYGRFLDQRDFEAFSLLFAEKDGEWIGGMGKARGRQAIRKFMEEKIGGGTGEAAAPNYHLFMNDVIDLNGDKASATTKWMFVIRNETGLPQPLLLGHYEDRFIREEGQWKFLQRIVFSDIPKDDPLSR